MMLFGGVDKGTDPLLDDAFAPWLRFGCGRFTVGDVFVRPSQQPPLIPPEDRWEVTRGNRRGQVGSLRTSLCLSGHQLGGHQHAHGLQLIFVGPIVAGGAPGVRAEPEGVLVGVVHAAEGVDAITIRSDVKRMLTRSERTELDLKRRKRERTEPLAVEVHGQQRPFELRRP